MRGEGGGGGGGGGGGFGCGVGGLGGCGGVGYVGVRGGWYEEAFSSVCLYDSFAVLMRALLDWRVLGINITIGSRAALLSVSKWLCPGCGARLLVL